VASEIAVGAAAIGVIRRVGPTGWTVLTALALDADRAAGHPGVRTSVRLLAAQLVLDKDTVARALLRLRRAGLVAHEPRRFAPGFYRLTISPAIVRHVEDLRVEPRVRRPQTATTGVQLALLEAD
jgi:DNA-binding IclR family transcriptional regulator